MSRPTGRIGPGVETQAVQPGPNPPGVEEVARAIAEENYWNWSAEDVRRGCRRLARKYVEAAAPALRQQGAEEEGARFRQALRAIHAACQEVAHEVEDPTQAVAEIEALTRQTLAAFSDSEGER